MHLLKRSAGRVQCIMCTLKTRAALGILDMPLVLRVAAVAARGTCPVQHSQQELRDGGRKRVGMGHPLMCGASTICGEQHWQRGHGGQHLLPSARFRMSAWTTQAGLSTDRLLMRLMAFCAARA
jgi:hypothetical protein